jgi:predicted phosphoribosyltransferase
MAIGCRDTEFLSPQGQTFPGDSHAFPAAPCGIEVAQVMDVPFDVAIGRGLAWCAHPHLSWGRLTARGRVMLVAAYVSASYVTVLTLLLLAR